MPYSLYSRRGIRIWIECTCRCDMTAAGAGAHYKRRRRVPFCVASLVLRTNPSVGNAETKSNVGKCHTYTELPFVAVVCTLSHASNGLFVVNRRCPVRKVGCDVPLPLPRPSPTRSRPRSLSLSPPRKLNAFLLTTASHVRSCDWSTVTAIGTMNCARSPGVQRDACCVQHPVPHLVTMWH